MEMSRFEVHPFREGTVFRHAAEPCVVVIFGATGDLTSRKLVPAIYNLAHEGQLPPAFSIVGFARRASSHEDFRAELRKHAEQHSRFLPINQAVWESLAQGIFYHQGDYADPS